jgi:hypothetical protein
MLKMSGKARERAAVSNGCIAVCKNRRLCAKNRETIDFPPRISLKSTITYNFIKISLILKVSGLN